jgi:glutamyl-tRNA synthetase
MVGLADICGELTPRQKYCWKKLGTPKMNSVELAAYTRTRFAPTPSGFLHTGNCLSFLFTADLAKRSGAKILLRIDDLDSARVRDEYIRDIFDTIKFLNLSWQDGPSDYSEYEVYSQKTRLPYYNKALEQLAASGKIFACRCSRSLQNGSARCHCQSLGIALSEPGVAWRIDTSECRFVNMRQWSGEIKKVPFPSGVENFIVRRKDDVPAYQLCSVIDDVHFAVDLIVRGRDLLDSSCAQLFLAEQLGYTRFLENTFVHHPVILSNSGEKISKSAGAGAQKLAKSAEARTQISELYSRVALSWFKDAV